MANKDHQRLLDRALIPETLVKMVRHASLLPLTSLFLSTCKPSQLLTKISSVLGLRHPASRSPPSRSLRISYPARLHSALRWRSPRPQQPGTCGFLDEDARLYHYSATESRVTCELPSALWNLADGLPTRGILPLFPAEREAPDRVPVFSNVLVYLRKEAEGKATKEATCDATLDLELVKEDDKGSENPWRVAQIKANVIRQENYQEFWVELFPGA